MERPIPNGRFPGHNVKYIKHYGIPWVRLQVLGHEIRKARLALELTQAQLADAAGLSRTTLNQLENGLLPDLGIRKVQSVLDKLGLALSVSPVPKMRRPDFIFMACAAANVGYRELLTSDELLHALLSGKVPKNRRPHLRTLLDEGSPKLIAGLVRDVGKWAKPGKVIANIQSIAKEIQTLPRVQNWLKSL